MIRVLQMVAHAEAGSDGCRGVNGPELRTLNALPLFDYRSIEITVSYSSAGRLWNRFQASGVDLVDFSSLGKFRWDDIGRITRLIREREIDVVHTQGPGSLDFFATVAAHRAGASIVVTRPVMICDLRVPAWRRAAYEFVDRYTLRKAHRIVAVSHAGYQHLVSHSSVSPGKIEVIYNGVDLSQFRPTPRGDRRQFGLPEDVPVVGACAQLTRGKGWEEFLHAVVGIRAKVPNLHAVIIGDGPMRSELVALSAALGLTDRVVFAGHLSDVSSALRCLDVVLHLSHREGLSVAIIEALACGLPCIVADVGGMRELVEPGNNGFVVGIGEVEAAVRYTVELLGNPQLLNGFGERSREICESRFQSGRMVKGYQQIYENLGRKSKALLTASIRSA